MNIGSNYVPFQARFSFSSLFTPLHISDWLSYWLLTRLDTDIIVFISCCQKKLWSLKLWKLSSVSLMFPSLHFPCFVLSFLHSCFFSFLTYNSFFLCDSSDLPSAPSTEFKYRKETRADTCRMHVISLNTSSHFQMTLMTVKIERKEIFCCENSFFKHI